MDTMEDYIDTAKEITRSFINHHGVVSQSIASYNKFLETYVQEIITEEPIISECETSEPFPIRHKIHFESVNITKPIKDEGDGETPARLTPNDCLNRSLTYAADMYARGYIEKFEKHCGSWNKVTFDPKEMVEITPYGRKKAVKEPKNLETRQVIPEYRKKFYIPIGKIPVMVRSDACHLKDYKTEQEFQANRECFLDPGGYFIINGKERVIVAQEKLPENRAVVFESMRHSKFECECEIRSSVENSLRPVCILWVRLMRESKRNPLGASGRKTDGQIFSLNPENSNNNNNPEVPDGDHSDDDSEEEVAGENNIRKHLFMHRGKQYSPGKQIVIAIPRLQKPIPLVLLFRALGFSNIGDITTFILQGDTDENSTQVLQLLQYSLDLWDCWQSQEQAQEIIGSLIKDNKPDLNRGQIRELGREVLNDFVLQNIGTTPDSDVEKGKFICDMTRRIIDVALRRRKHEDRDHLINKRFELAGSLFLQLFKRLWKRVSSDAQRYINKKLDLGVPYDLKMIIHPSTLTRGFNYSVSTGNWADKKIGYCASGCISQELNRCSYMSTLSHLRRVTTPSKLHRSVTARQLHCTNWGMICPNETPEGEPVGLVQNFSLTACITVGSKSTPVLEYLKKDGLIYLKDCTTENMKLSCKIFLNGTWLGVHKEPLTLVNGLRDKRRSGEISHEVSIAYNRFNREIDIRTDAGRICRPLLVIRDNKLRITEGDYLERIRDKTITWEDLLQNGVVEELDTAEIINTRIAMWPKDLGQTNSIYTHCEIHPSLILGLSASTIPYADHNQSPRNTYQSGMAKQSIGMYATNFQFRCDSLLSHVMHYPHKPLISTMGADICKIWELPAGQECIVACMTMGGYNQEDSVILNKSSIDRGLLRSSVMQTYTDIQISVSERREHDESFEKPSPEICRYLSSGENYKDLDDDGLPSVGTRINERDPVIGKTIQSSGGLKRDASTFAKLNTKGVVRQSFVTTNEDGYRTHKVVVQETRIPKIGDKFASRHGQKGVVGMIYNQEDMPFTKDGITPDIIINPHAVPSRMTIGHLIEALVGKAACSFAAQNIRTKLDGTAFETPLTADTFTKFMTQVGFEKHGNEILYDGATGHKYEAPIFMGINYYQRLRHMVDDKLNVRSRGTVTQLEGQPKRGLTREGAQRFGEMERDVTISHGASGFLHERLFTASDAAWYKVCNTCGYLVSPNPYVNKELKHPNFYQCRICLANNQPTDNLSTIALPKAAKLLFQELISMNILPRLQLTPDLLSKGAMKVDKQKIQLPSGSVSIMQSILTKMDPEANLFPTEPKIINQFLGKPKPVDNVEDAKILVEQVVQSGSINGVNMTDKMTNQNHVSSMEVSTEKPTLMHNGESSGGCENTVESMDQDKDEDVPWFLF